MKVLSLLAALALFGSLPAFANDQELCDEQVAELENAPVDELGKPGKSQIKGHIEQARKAQEAGDTKACLLHASKALQELKAPGERPATERNQGN